MVDELNITDLGVWDFDVTPPSVYHVSLGKYPHLWLVAREPDETESFRLTRLDIFFNLEKDKRSKILRKFSTPHDEEEQIAQNLGNTDHNSLAYDECLTQSAKTRTLP